MNTVFTCTMPTPIGDLTLLATDEGLAAISWPTGDAPSRPLPAAIEHPGHPVLAAAVAQLDEYFAGERTTFDLPLVPRGTPFQLLAWEALREIPYGEVRTYGEQAVRIGRPTAFRAVGAANGRNPLPIVVPCHRVIGSTGSLTGFAGGIEVKRWLLEHERQHVPSAEAAASVASRPLIEPVPG
jgi:methylated-DNA-[protein]-cysteine S-methyltransferase